MQDLDRLRVVGIGRDLLHHDEVTQSQHIGRAAAWLGCSALLVPSARYACTNIVVFPNNIEPDDYVEISH
ncbi:MAG: hypothetical protein ABR559_00490 [Gemmatimonadota bacterium]